jgi:type VI secretion system secreted protein Hcp
MAARPEGNTSTPQNADLHTLLNGELAAVTTGTEDVMSIPGPPSIKGESTIAGYAGDIDLTSVKLGAANSVPAGTGAGAGRASFNNLVITHAYDLASPKLMDAVDRGIRLRIIKVFLLRNVSGRTSQVLAITLGNAMVVSVQEATPSSSGMETVTFAYDSIRYDYNGPRGQKESTCWNVALNSSTCPS